MKKLPINSNIKFQYRDYFKIHPRPIKVVNTIIKNIDFNILYLMNRQFNNFNKFDIF